MGWRWRGLLFVVVFAVYAVSPVMQNTDSFLSLPTAHSIVHRGDLYLDNFTSRPVVNHYGHSVLPNGHSVNGYPWTPALFLVPAVVGLDLAHAVGLGPDAKQIIDEPRSAGLDETDLVQALTASLVVALAAVFVALIAYERLTGSDRRRRWLALAIATGFAFGTAAWSTASRALWQHGPSMLALAVGLLMAQRLVLDAPEGSVATRRAVLMGVALAASYTFRPTNAIPVLLLSAWMFWQQRRRFGAYVLGAALVALPWLLVNQLTFGELFPSYTPGGKLGWHQDFFEALATNLVSPARGLLVYTPIALLAIPGVFLTRLRLRPLDRVLALCVVLHLLAVSASRETWWGGHSYGARFTSDMLVFLAALATPTVGWVAERWEHSPRTRSATIAASACAVLLAVSLFTNSQGALSRATNCWNATPNIDRHPSRIWSWSHPQFLAGLERLQQTGSIRDAILTCPTLQEDASAPSTNAHSGPVGEAPRVEQPQVG